MSSAFKTRLKALSGSKVLIDNDGAHPDVSGLETIIHFEGGAVLHTAYWRLIKDGRQALSSFDHNQKYGLATSIDAIKDLHTILESKTVREAGLDQSTGDLIFSFSENLILQILNFTGYEIWTMTFPDGSVEYSNYNQ